MMLGDRYFHHYFLFNNKNVQSELLMRQEVNFCWSNKPNTMLGDSLILFFGDDSGVSTFQKAKSVDSLHYTQEK